MTPQFIPLLNERNRDAAILRVQSLPVGTDPVIEVVIRERKDRRTLDQNAAMWAGPLKDLADQAWVNGRQFSAEVWHEHAKREFLPEDDDPDLAELVRNPESYRKWAYTPGGDRVLIGSTTQLTKRGMGEYLDRLCAMGAGLGVLFHGAPGRYG